MNTNDFRQTPFAALDNYCRRLTDSLLKYVDPDKELRLLDLGCGTGQQLFRLAEVLPKAQLTGIDISLPNIEIARTWLRRSPHQPRLRFEAADYLDFQAEPFDLIVSWGVLHYVPAPDAVLFGKLAGDLKVGGLLLYTIPYRCFFNGMLQLVRRAFAACRGPLTDRLIFQSGRWLCGPNFCADRLRERVFYMYHLPVRTDHPALRAYLADSFGFQRIAQRDEPHESIAQLKTRLIVLRKPPFGKKEDCPSILKGTVPFFPFGGEES